MKLRQSYRMFRYPIILLIILPALNLTCKPTREPDTNTEGYRILESYRQVHVLKNGRHMATYLYDTAFLKPVLYPVYSASGIMIQRSYPFSVEEGESHDHPHHTGLFFTYGTEGEVNGNNYWANQEGLSKIKHVAISKKKAGSDEAILGIKANWTGRNGETVLEEDRTMTFSGNDDRNIIDFTIRLKAIAEEVVFKDTKEGMFGLRVADWLSENDGNGLYLNSSGDTTEAQVWGKRAAWVRLEGSFEGEPIGILIMNHPSSVNFPTFWHARGYGLFAANPLGQSVFEAGRGMENPEPLNYVIKKGESGLFKFRLIIHEGDLNTNQIEAAFKEYSN